MYVSGLVMQWDKKKKEKEKKKKCDVRVGKKKRLKEAR